MPFFIDFSTKIEIFPHFSSISGIFLYVAVVSDNDGSAFITKAEFDSLKNNFQAQIDNYNQSIDSKIDGAIAAYLAGISFSADSEFIVDWVTDFYTPTELGLSGKYLDIITSVFGSWNSGALCNGKSIPLGSFNAGKTEYMQTGFCVALNGEDLHSGYTNYIISQPLLGDSPKDGLYFYTFPTTAGAALMRLVVNESTGEFRFCNSNPGTSGFVTYPGSWEYGSVNNIDLLNCTVFDQNWSTLAGWPVQTHWAGCYYGYEQPTGEMTRIPLLKCTEGEGKIKWSYLCDAPRENTSTSNIFSSWTLNECFRGSMAIAYFYISDINGNIIREVTSSDEAECIFKKDYPSKTYQVVNDVEMKSGQFLCLGLRSRSSGTSYAAGTIMDRIVMKFLKT